jgi:hypothetical protein
VYQFSAEKNTITLLQCSGELPIPRKQHSSVIIGHLLIILGGRDRSGTSLNNDLYSLNLSMY